VDQTKPEPVEGRLIGDNTPVAAVTAVVDCWRTIGVLGGNQTCLELETQVHCRNCPVYAEAAAKLLDRAQPPGYREEWTRRLAERRSEGAAGRKSVVLFRAGGDWLGLATEVLQEVAERRVIRSLPHQRNEAILGLVNVRGELLVCLSLSRLLGLESSPAPVAGKGTADVHSAARLLVAGRHGQRQAFLVDEVSGIHHLQLPDGRETAARFVSGGNKFTRALLEWQGRSVVLLDDEHLFNTLDQSFA
jgi:chemotaxis-related protein WspD